MSAKPIERRLRIRRVDDVDRGTAKMNPEMMKRLGIEDEVEIVIAGKKRYRFRVIPSEKVPVNEVWANSLELKQYGIADRTIATVRRPLRKE